MLVYGIKIDFCYLTASVIVPKIKGLNVWFRIVTWSIFWYVHVVAWTVARVIFKIFYYIMCIVSKDITLKINILQTHKLLILTTRYRLKYFLFLTFVNFLTLLENTTFVSLTKVVIVFVEILNAFFPFLNRLLSFLKLVFEKDAWRNMTGYGHLRIKEIIC